MTREEYIKELRARIAHLPAEEREAALTYYMEYLEDAGDKTMDEIIAELGTPGEVAERIIAECAHADRHDRGENDHKGCLVGMVALLTSPLWLLFAFVFSLVGFAILITVVAMLAVFAALSALCFGLGIWSIFISPATGILMLGASFILAALAILFVLLFTAAGSVTKRLISAVKNRHRRYDG